MHEFVEPRLEQSRVTAVFEDRALSFILAKGATLEELSDRLADLGQRRRRPVAITVKFDPRSRLGSIGSVCRADNPAGMLNSLDSPCQRDLDTSEANSTATLRAALSMALSKTGFAVRHGRAADVSASGSRIEIDMSWFPIHGSSGLPRSEGPPVPRPTSSWNFAKPAPTATTSSRFKATVATRSSPHPTKPLMPHQSAVQNSSSS